MATHEEIVLGSITIFYVKKINKYLPMLFYYLENVRLWYKPERSKNNRTVWDKINESKLLDRKILHCLTF